MAQFTWRGVNYQERVQSMGVSPDETFESDRSMAVRVYDVDWANRESAVQNLLGYAQVRTNSSAQKWLDRTTPHFHYEWDNEQGQPYLYATQVRVQGVGLTPPNLTRDLGAYRDGTHAHGKYTQARLTVRYQTLPYEILDNSEVTQLAGVGGGPDEASWERYIFRIVRPTAEFFTVPQGSYRVVDGAAAPLLTFGVGIPYSSYTLQVTWFGVPEIGVPCWAVNNKIAASVTEDDLIEGVIGTVNRVDFLDYTAGQLLLLGAELKPYRDPFGQRIYDITYWPKYLQRTHQKIYINKTLKDPPGWFEVTTTGSSNLVVKDDDISIFNWRPFAVLFQPPLTT